MSKKISNPPPPGVGFKPPPPPAPPGPPRKLPPPPPPRAIALQLGVDLREFARKYDGGCQLRIQGVCNWAPTCLCHLRLAAAAGMGQKPPDFCGVIGCDSCHAVIDGRRPSVFRKEDIRSFELYALVRTFVIYEQHGLVLVPREA